MTSPADAKAVLRSFADTAPTTPTYRDAIDDAARAVQDVRTAGEFVAAGGHAALRRAVAAAVRANDEPAARRGRAVLRELARYRRTADHFRSGHGTVLSRDGQATDT